ncbi:MAG: tRNA pseudouridine(55) synthase TruB [Lachnospiraceae bacterium]|nr:tRNA pseudouridine(55) synthase TruB [Lachnospiraceae bacterium]
MINGIINVYKEAGFTSHDVVAKLRGILKQKKIGHTGTLDPDATGVLPVCLGRGTKLCDMLTDETKTYEAQVLLGVVTDTQDSSGAVLAEWEVTSTEKMVRECAASFVGEQLQVPPMYSALKVNGKKLYELAREGKTVERKARPVTFYEIEILQVALPRFTMRVHCSKGTYIRTLCHDIGEKLGCGACMDKLVRTRVGRFALEDSLKLSQIEELTHKEHAAGYSFVNSIESMFVDLKKIIVSEKWDKALYNGNSFPMEWDCADKEQVLVYTSQQEFVGVYRYERETQVFRLEKMFMERQENK